MKEEPSFRGFIVTHVQACLADPNKIRVIAEATKNVGEILPYLNALLPNATYGLAGPTLTFKRDWRIITLYPHVVVMAKADDEEDALAILEWLRDLINETYRRRDEIMPRFERRRMLGPFDIYALLPRTDCKACGEATCVAFACGLLEGRHKPEGCTVLEGTGRARICQMMGLSASEVVTSGS